MAKAGLYALGFVILLGVLIIGGGFVMWDAFRGSLQNHAIA